MAQLVKEFASGIYNLILGLFTTGKHLGRHAITVQYPKERWTMPERSRGMVVLLSDKETGELNCNACLLCMRACPSGAIDIDFVKDEKNRRQLKEFKLNYHMCCFCGLCEASCNFTAIKLATKYEFPVFDKDELLWDSKRLQEMGRDVPYVKKVKKKPEARKPVPKKPETAGEKPAVKPPSDKPQATETKPDESEPKTPEAADKQQPADEASDTEARKPAETTNSETDKGKDDSAEANKDGEK